MQKYVLFAAFLLIPLPSLRSAQKASNTQPVVRLPQGAVTRLPPPDGKWFLIFECPNDH
jgi:hypothetical protein